MKFRVIKEYPHVGSDKKIITIKADTIIEDDYSFSVPNGKYYLDSEIVTNNPEYFEQVDWKLELVKYLKTNKIPQPAILAKKLTPFIEQLIIDKSTDAVDKKDLANILDWASMYYNFYEKVPGILNTLTKYGYSKNDKGDLCKI